MEKKIAIVVAETNSSGLLGRVLDLQADFDIHFIQSVPETKSYLNLQEPIIITNTPHMSDVIAPFIPSKDFLPNSAKHKRTCAKNRILRKKKRK